MLGAVVREGDTSLCLGRDGDSGIGMRARLGSASGLRRWQAGGWLPAPHADRWERCLRRSRWMCCHGTALLGQAARNMVMQEDAILHSEDARSNSKECGALVKPSGPAESLAEMKGS
ncbi:BLOC-1-related complex subunit 7 isoform X1 [Vidua chalybeata]|uniref:BLOC-1-related complex subunit 7 isoform X1 n=1 Tax=Vidua chalybeata TaxID=81927 RepID=UPI0023A86624|nr:BLOC-1-related complex subunit 7 isoform X1 [Vidua chalybeata]